MMHKRIAALLSLIMVVTAFVPVVAEEGADAGKDERVAYLHAREGVLTETPQETTVSVGDEVNVYLAVDDPNKGEGEDGTLHEKPQFDMNGYTVKIYYDTTYLELQSNPSAPIDYKIPNDGQGNDSTTQVKPDGSDDEDDNETVPDLGADFFVTAHGVDELDGTTWNAAYITVFFTGTYLPEPDNEGWYNLCKLPLKAANKKGSTQVYIDYGTADDYTFRIFAKDIPGGGTSPTFICNFEHGGYHTINIEDSTRPLPPVPTPGAGSYTEAQQVTLTAAEGCSIFYSTTGPDSGFVQYSDSTDTDKKEKIQIARTSDLWCYATRNGLKSDVKKYEYHIIPKAPVLFNEKKDEPIPNIYGEYGTYKVYASDSSDFGPVDIENGNKIYYTFGNQNPGEDGWIELPNDQSIEVSEKCTVRLVTYNMVTKEYSDVSEYYLSIKPGRVTADPKTGEYDEKIDVTLTTDTRGAVIYYTTDGTDPRYNNNGIEYTVPITLGQDTTLRAAAKLGDEWGEVLSEHYIFDLYDDYGVDAFYPSGGYEGSVNVTLTPHNPDNDVIYSTDGGKTWQDYDEVIVVDRDTEIIAKAKDEQGKTGDEYVFTYKIKPLPPVFAPESTQFTNADVIAIFCPERTEDNKERYELYYTTDGTDPTKYGIPADESDAAVVDIKGYTIVSAAIKKDGTTWSTVVTHSYDIITQKPVKPITTLVPGTYTHEIENEDGFSTQFMPVSSGTEIYYTISYDGSYLPDPVPGEGSTILYDGNPIEIKGNTIIKAVAVNRFNIKSDVGIFSYNIIPEAPEAAPSATIAGSELPLVPVNAVKGSTVKYDLNGFENEFKCETGSFYIDTSTGNAYEDEAKTNPLGKTSTGKNTGKATLEISAELNGVDSLPNMYIYSVTGKDDGTLAPPYADKPTGVYDEIDIDGNNNLLIVKLYSLNKDAVIQYMLDNDGKWEDYDGSVKLAKDSVLQIRCVKDGNTSTVEGYVYNFVPIPPVITLESGRYGTDPLPITNIRIDTDRAPEPYDNYEIYYRRNGDPMDYRLTWDNDTPILIEHTMSLKAYVKNKSTGKISENTVHYYIVEQDMPADGGVEMASPYYGLKRLGAHLISSEPYSGGIRLFTDHPDGRIMYYYTYQTVDGTEITTNSVSYDNSPIFVSPSMEWIRVTAWLVDDDGNEIDDSRRTFGDIDFVHLEIPRPSLESQNKAEFPKGTQYTIVNDYPDDKDISIYYTLDGTDPSNEANPSRLKYTGTEALKLNRATVIRTVYHSPCGTCYECKNENEQDCWYEVYGEVGTFRYTVPVVEYQYIGGGGGGGTVYINSGGETVDNTRKYTKDMFGHEHPTHVSYISGYPDGTVQPDGDITREEIAAILYRIKNKTYEEPFTTTGKVFPDVAITRWSATEIEYMTDDGVIKGYPDGEFKPARDLTRAEFSALVRRFIGIESADAENIFPDLEDRHWAYDDIITLYDSGLLTGYEDGTIRPEDKITRAEVMTVINKILGRNPSEPYVKSLDFNPFSDLAKEKWYYVIVMEATITHNYYLDDEGVEIKWEDCK